MGLFDNFQFQPLPEHWRLEAEAWVAQQVREQYRFFVVDEYQDVSPLQQALLDLSDEAVTALGLDPRRGVYAVEVTP